MKDSVSKEKAEDLRIEKLSFTYEKPVMEVADWYDEEVPTSRTSATLKNISFFATSGELILITGASGCGKTTLLQIINGIATEFSNGIIKGDVLFCGKSIMDLPIDQRGSLIGSVFQNPRSQFFNMLVEDELRFGCENLNLPVEIIEKRISTLIKAFRLESYLERNLFHLSGGEKQKVACLSVAAMHPPVMLYDEPSSNLDQAGMHALAQLMYTFKQAGVIQLVAEHRLAYVSELVDQVVFMKDGQIEACFSGKQLRLLSNEQLSRMGLRSVRAISPPTSDHQLALQTPCGQKSRTKTRDIDPEDLYIESLKMTYAKASQPLLRIKDYRFKAKRVHALVANNGKGKSTLLRSLAGLEKRAKGYVRYRKQRYKLRQMRQLCSVVFQDVNHQLLTASVYNELLLSLEESNLPLREKEEQIIALAQRLELGNFLYTHPFALSGGQKQRLAFATALLMNRPILVLDEPTSGLDLKHMVAMAEILAEYARDHLVLLATHDQELLHLLDAEVHELLDPAR